MAKRRRLYHLVRGRRLRLLREEIRQRAVGRSVLNKAGVRLYFDPADLRGRKLYQSGGCLDRDALSLWEQLVLFVRPTVVLDVGANYGEIGLGVRYPEPVVIHLVEANPRVVRFLQKTAESLECVSVHEAAAGDQPGTTNLYLMGAISSGLGSTIPIPEAERAVQVEMITIDSLLSLGREDRLCFKIDVEGGEVSVLSGMSRLLGSTNWAGMIEFVHLAADEMAWLESTYRVIAMDVASGKLVELPRPLPESMAEVKALGMPKTSQCSLAMPSSHSPRFVGQCLIASRHSVTDTRSFANSPV